MRARVRRRNVAARPPLPRFALLNRRGLHFEQRLPRSMRSPHPRQGRLGIAALERVRGGYGLTFEPRLKLRDRPEPESADVDAAQVRADVAVEGVTGDPEGFGGFLALETEARNGQLATSLLPRLRRLGWNPSTRAGFCNRGDWI